MDFIPTICGWLFLAFCGFLIGWGLRGITDYLAAQNSTPKPQRPAKSIWTVLERHAEEMEHWVLGKKTTDTRIYVTLEQDQYGNLRAWQDDEQGRKAVNAHFFAARYGFTNIKSTHPVVE